MASPPRTAEREEERRLNMRTLVIASAASATAAVLTSQLWIAGTWIAAAMTPVVVALVSELLHRPTDRIARSITTGRQTLPEAGGAAPPARPDADPLRGRAPEERGADVAEPPVRVYRAGDAEPRPPRTPGATTRRRKIAYGAVLATAGLAFVIAISALTFSELVAGGSVGKNDGRTTLLGGGKKKDEGASDPKTPTDTTTDEQAQPDEQTEEQPAPDEDQQQTTPTDESTTEEPPPVQDTPAPGEPLQEQPQPDTQP